MPIGIKKTFQERERDNRWQRERYERRIAKKPLASPCLPGRLRHEFGRGVGTAQKNCAWCHKSREQIKKERARAINTRRETLSLKSLSHSSAITAKNVCAGIIPTLK